MTPAVTINALGITQEDSPTRLCRYKRGHTSCTPAGSEADR
jgi:hypothetical protein